MFVVVQLIDMLIFETLSSKKISGYWEEEKEAIFWLFPSFTFFTFWKSIVTILS